MIGAYYVCSTWPSTDTKRIFGLSIPCCILLLLATAARAPLAPRPDYAGLYRDAPHLEVETRREGDSLRLYLRLPAPARLGPGHPCA